MMGKGERTRAAILHKAAELINVQGVSGASMADVMQATGLQKGGIYNHFQSKEQLALEAFDYGFRLSSERMMEAIRDKHQPLERLEAIIRFFEEYVTAPPLRGGCILMNTAIDSDDTSPHLRERAMRAMTLWRKLIRRTVQQAITEGKLRPETDSDTVASLVIALSEGALMMSRLYDDTSHIRRAVDHLVAHVRSLRVAE
jgi:AcrR family transcriptional regulator